jgi:hypothetical protein
MIVQSVHHNHSVMYTLYNHQLYQGKNKVHSILWLWCPLCTIISCIRERTRYIRYDDDDVHFVQSSAISGKEQGTFDTMFPWYSWWLYKVYITIIVSNVPCSFPDTADDCTKCTSSSSYRMYLVLSLIQLMIVQSGHHNHSIECTLSRYIRYYDCDVHFVQSSAISGKEQGTFDTMIVMYTLYNHQLYQGKNKVHSILW